MMKCGTGTGGLTGMLEAEYAFGERARSSVRGAFLDYLAEDSLVLQPGPTSGRAFYTATADVPGKLEWYPAAADLAGSGDLGFSSGPWTYTDSPGGKQLHGHFLSVWKRGDACRWQVVFDGGVSHAAPENPEPALVPERAERALPSAPPQKLIAEDALGRTLGDFRATSLDEGFAPGLRTYARTGDFVFYTDGEAPLGSASANRLLASNPIPQAWKEAGSGRSSDSSFAFSVGVFDASSRRRYACVQIWQYSSRVANWGLRVLLINPLPPSMPP